LFFSLKHKIDLFSINFKQAYLKEDFRYTEDLKNIDSYYISESYISDADIKLHKGSFLFNIGSAFTNNNITNNNFSSSSKQENSFAYFSAIQYNSRYLKLNSILRKEWHSTFKVPLIPTLAFESKISRNLKFRIKYNRNFRNPTYNDRFWLSGGAIGNINLVPENSWNSEFGFDVKIKNLYIGVTGYKLNIFDMIVWQDVDNGIWMPNNIKEVYSRGIEIKTSLKFWKLSCETNYLFTKSTHEIAANNLDISVGQQLRYVPLHKGSASINFIEEDFLLSLRTSYAGEVITSYALPTNKTLDGFFLTDFSIKYKMHLLPVSLKAKVKNLTNESYVTYLNYPNPGREYLFTIEYIIN
jgi:iron complex outermembrane receptor protein